MIIEEIVDKLHELRREYCSNNSDYMTNPPKYVIYMGLDTYCEMKDEISNENKGAHHENYIVEAYYNDTIFGFPIYRAVDHDHWEIYRKGAN